MSDIINRAKRLFENRYHDEPWLALLDSSQERFWIETDNFAEVCGDFVSEDDTRLAAAAPELAQALSEENWEYTQEIYFNGKWQPIYEDLWYDNPEECKSLFLDIEPWKYHDEPLRIVRRRVSPVEVVDA